MADLPDPIPLRAHDVLCFQGFRGKGYSEAFVQRMRALAEAFAADPGRRVRLEARPASLCAACPHGGEAGCTLGGEGHEAHMAAQDRTVLARLGWAEGTIVPWEEILARIRAKVQGADLPSVCTTCPWLPLGWCAEGVDRLRNGG